MTSEPLIARIGPRKCESCGKEIPTKRLAVKPNATQCVPCLEAQGDVPRTKRYDEYVNGEEVSQTLYTDEDRYIAGQVNRIQKDPLPTLALEQAVGDDSFVAKDGNSVDAVAGLDESELEPDLKAHELTLNPVMDNISDTEASTGEPDNKVPLKIKLYTWAQNKKQETPPREQTARAA